MIMLKRIICGVLVAAMALSVAGCSLGSFKGFGKKSEKKTSDTVVAVVGDTKITLGDMETGVKSIEDDIIAKYGEDYESNEEAMKSIVQQKKDYLDYLVEGEIFAQKANEMGLTASDDEVQVQLQQLMDQFDSEEAYKAALEQSGMTIDQIKEQLAENIKINKVIDSLFASIQVTDEEIKAYYDSNESVRESTLEDAKATIKDILQQDKEYTLYQETLENWKTEMKVEEYYDLL
jgi:foldase protein PrsA